MTPAPQETLGDRIRTRRTELAMSQGQLAKQVGLTQPTISSLERNESKVTTSIGSIAHALHVSALWLETGFGDKKISNDIHGYRRAYKSGGPVKEYEVPVLPSKGSCGGNTTGKPDVGDIQAALAPIYKDEAFFARYGVETGDVVAIIADGDSGANFIVHGDTVFFRTSQCDRLESGLIYALDTPDGPRIKRVHRRSDGHVILSCDNPDRVRYPDEDYTAEAAENLKVLGQYLYRQG
jgi:transcriptional regulator with XRE-family HTH domain